MTQTVAGHSGSALFLARQVCSESDSAICLLSRRHIVTSHIPEAHGSNAALPSGNPGGSIEQCSPRFKPDQRKATKKKASTTFFEER